MGAISDISSLLLQLYKLWQEHRGKFVVSPAELYDKYVQPSYRLLKEVHSDYEDLYLELSERVHSDDGITHETIEWFTRARTRRAFDRSELALIEIPSLSGQTAKITDFNAEGIGYVAAVQRYFRPENRSRQLFADRIYRLLGNPSVSVVTEWKLVYLSICSQLETEDRRVLEAESDVEFRQYLSEVDPDLTIITVLSAAHGDISDAVKLRLEVLDSELQKTSENAPPEHWSGVSPKRFRWREVLEDHILAQRDSLARAIRDVQVRYVRLRILADR